MFQPETEDMLPRPAPKPSACLTEALANIQPTVPEVSILFGQQNLQNANGPQQQQQQQQQTHQQQQKPSQPQSYASWKKQVLPKVTYPATATNTEAGSSTTTTRSNLYPLRTITSAPSLESLNYRRNPGLEGLQTHHNVVYSPPPPQIHDMNPAGLMYGLQPAHTQRRSLDTVMTNGVIQQQQHQQQQQTARSCPAYVRQQEDILTICAGTQTEPMLYEGTISPQQKQQQFASKEDVQRLQETIEEMREMQLRLLQMCGALLVSQRNERNVSADDKAVQCNLPQNSVPSSTDSPQRNYQQFKPSPPAFLTPRATKPQAQSTTYRPNTPVRVGSPNTVGFHQIQPSPLQQQNIGAAGLPKAATEKSIAMNELALKYLPNEKLNELLNELNISPRGQPTTQAQRLQTPDAANLNKNKENVEKGPSDMSNASYKYLKKYRLLPEEGNDYQQSPHASPSIPRKSADQQYQLSCIPEQLLNLDHIRNQPKFL